MIGSTAIVQAYAYGKFLGELNVVFNDVGEITSASGEPLIMDSSLSEDKATLARIAEAAKPLIELSNDIVAKAAVAISGLREECRLMECEMGNLIADAMLDYVSNQGIQIALQNGGGLRASINAGDITMGEILTVLPFQNTLATFEVSGATILSALENGVSQVEEGAGRFPQVSGMRYSIDLSANPGSRISDVTVAGSPLNLEKLYGVVSNNYVRNGGDGYKMFRGAKNAYDFGPDLADIAIEFLVKNGPYAPRGFNSPLQLYPRYDA